MIRFSTQKVQIYRNNALSSLFHRMMWGQAMSFIWDEDVIGDWTYGNNLLEPRLGMVILCYSSTYMPLHFDRARRFGRMAIKYPSVQPDVGILEVTSSHLNRDHASVREGMLSMAKGLEGEGVNCGYFYEKLLLEGRQTLEGVQTLFIPNGTYMPRELAEILATWTRKGGILVCYGPAGVFSRYGRDSGLLLKDAFGGRRWEPNPHRSRWTLREGDRFVHSQFPIGRGVCKVYRGALGQGKVFVFSSVSALDRMRPVAVRLVREATILSFYCRAKHLDLVMRDAGEHRYLYLLNPDLYASREDDILVRGKVGAVVDLGLQRPVNVPVEFDNGYSSFRVRLEPAEGTVLRIAE